MHTFCIRIQLIRITRLKSLTFLDIWELQWGIKELQERNVEWASFSQYQIKITATSNSICSTCPSLKSLLPEFAIPVLFYVLPSREHNWDFSWFSNCCRQFVMTSTVVSSPVQEVPSQQLVTWMSCGHVTLINSYLFTYRRVTVNKLGQQVRLFK